MGRAYWSDDLAAFNRNENCLFNILTQETRNQQEKEIQKLKRKWQVYKRTK